MSYLSKFQSASQHINVVGNVVFVEEVQLEELTKEIKGANGQSVRLILDAPTQHRQLGSISEDKPLFVRVLDVGKGFYDAESSSDIPLDVKPGYILLVPSMSVRWLSAWGGLISSSNEKIGYVRENEKIAYFVSQEQFDLYRQEIK